jgi:hypothetical protein
MIFDIRGFSTVSTPAAADRSLEHPALRTALQQAIAR